MKNTRNIKTARLQTMICTSCLQFSLVDLYNNTYSFKENPRVSCNVLEPEFHAVVFLAV